MNVLRALLTFVFLVFQLPAYCVSRAEEHPVIKPMPRSQLVAAQSRFMNYSAYEFQVKEGKKTERVEKEGQYWHLRYLIKSASGKVDRSVSRQEILRNFKEAVWRKVAASFSK